MFVRDAQETDQRFRSLNEDQFCPIRDEQSRHDYEGEAKMAKKMHDELVNTIPSITLVQK